MGVSADASIGMARFGGKSVEIRVNVHSDLLAKDYPVGEGCIA